MRRPICFDLTHLVSRLGIRHPSGIDKVDLAYARHFAAGQCGFGPSLHYGVARPHILPAAASREVVELARSAHWDGEDISTDQACLRLRAMLTGSEMPSIHATKAQNLAVPSRWLRYRREISTNLARTRLRLTSNMGAVPRNAVYLNAAQHLFEYHRFFSWMRTRPDVTPVFVVHDLLPLDYPEYFPPGYKARFNRRVETMFTHGRAFITTTNDVRDRILEELARRELRAVPIHVEPLPSSLRMQQSNGIADEALAAVPYFVVVGTIEPRKNHSLLLNVWRQLAEANARSGTRVPKLVIVGGRGWENEQVVDILDRGLLTRPHIIEAAGLSTAGLVHIIANARALLMPSHAEGYGLPMVEALTLRTPVIATDAPVFREVTQKCATYVSPLDGVGWRDAVYAFADRRSKEASAAQVYAKGFEPPTWLRYFEGVEGFLSER
jgi:glycosyltransferase involved in cell wall biosynthesis